jgi:hypothetical protein
VEFSCVFLGHTYFQKFFVKKSLKKVLRKKSLKNFSLFIKLFFKNSLKNKIRKNGYPPKKFFLPSRRIQPIYLHDNTGKGHEENKWRSQKGGVRKGNLGSPTKLIYNDLKNITL